MSRLEKITEQIAELEEEGLSDLVKDELGAGTSPMIIFDACRAGMSIVGERFEANEYFVSDLMMSGELFGQCNAILEPELEKSATEKKGKIVIGTVKGDIHDIGKNLCVALLKAAGYEVIDLGVDVPAATFIEKVNETGARILALSGLLTVAFDSMRDTIAAADDAGLRPHVKVMIGGGPITSEVQDYCNADNWGNAAQTCVALADQYMEEFANV